MQRGTNLDLRVHFKIVFKVFFALLFQFQVHGSFIFVCTCRILILIMNLSISFFQAAKETFLLERLHEVMSNSLDKPAYSKDETSITSSAAAIGGNKPVDKAVGDKQPLLELPQKFTKKTLNLNIWDAPIISGFVSFKEILGQNLGKALYVLLMLTLTFMLAQV